jgi:hypothetical protein
MTRMLVWIIRRFGPLVRLLVGELVQELAEFLLLDSVPEVDDRAICPYTYNNADDEHATACDEKPDDVRVGQCEHCLMIC